VNALRNSVLGTLAAAEIGFVGELAFERFCRDAGVAQVEHKGTYEYDLLAGTPTQIKLELKTKRTQETRAPLNKYDNKVTAFNTTL
jgi:hypothetical protein